MGKNKDILFMTEDCTIFENTMYYLLRNMNLVCKKNLFSGDTRIYPGIPEENGFANQLASRIMIWGENLVFIPKKAKAIWFSDLDMQHWEKVEYEDVPEECWTEYVALQAFFYKGKLYMLAPRCGDSAIVKWNGGEGIQEFALWDSFKQVKHPFIGVVCTKNGILFPGYEQEHSIFVSRQGVMETVEGQYIYYKKLSKALFLAQCANGVILQITQNEVRRDISCIIKREMFHHLIGQYTNGFYQLFFSERMENEEIRLEEMIKMIVKLDEAACSLKGDCCAQRITAVILGGEKLGYGAKL